MYHPFSNLVCHIMKGRTHMASQTPSQKAASDKSGGSSSCPQCGCDLGDLAHARCPKCNFEYNHETLHRWETTPILARVRTALFGVTVGLVVIVLLHSGTLIGRSSGLTNTLVGLDPLEACADLLLGLSAIQACFELGLTMPILGVPRWRRCWIWWEGIVIGYGVCAITLYLTGCTVSLFEAGFLLFDDYHGRVYFYRIHLGLSPTSQVSMAMGLVLAVESILVQWAVVAYRTRLSGCPTPRKRLAAACLLAKSLTSLLWAFTPFLKVLA
jgi:hypothetical protein